MCMRVWIVGINRDKVLDQSKTGLRQRMPDVMSWKRCLPSNGQMKRKASKGCKTILAML